MAASSAAGGLRMSVHGLTEQMTLRAAREASLGAGAIVVLATVGRIDDRDVEALIAVSPRVVLLAGGVDHGDTGTVLHNARGLAACAPRLPDGVPVVYAGNRAAAADVRAIFEAAGVEVDCVENVYPRFDTLNLEPVRAVIQKLFSAHITRAPGMARVRAMVSDEILPTPGAVLRATELLADVLGDVVCVDVGGATTDVHSVIDPHRPPRAGGRPPRARIGPEPRSRRTVEGDLGVFLNARHVAAAAPGAAIDLDSIAALPASTEALGSALELARHACRIALERHVGRVRMAYDSGRAVELVEGRDLSGLDVFVATGGALTRLPGAKPMLRALLAERGAHDASGVHSHAGSQRLLPPADARVVVDRHYVMAAAGVLAARHPGGALALILASLGVAGPEAGRG